MKEAKKAEMEAWLATEIEVCLCDVHVPPSFPNLSVYYVVFGFPVVVTYRVQGCPRCDCRAGKYGDLRFFDTRRRGIVPSSPRLIVCFLPLFL